MTRAFFANLIWRAGHTMATRHKRTHAEMANTCPISDATVATRIVATIAATDARVVSIRRALANYQPLSDADVDELKRLLATGLSLGALLFDDASDGAAPGPCPAALDRAGWRPVRVQPVSQPPPDVAMGVAPPDGP